MGEAVKPSDVEAWLEHGSAQVMNAYGPTECTIIVTVSRPLTAKHEAPVIGLPLHGVSTWVTQPDDFNYLCPIGVPGELLVGGPLVASGYLHDEDQTAASFVTQPAFVQQLERDSENSRRMYRTGDIVRQNNDGSLTYIGRRDNQVKVHGQRVETSEIENWIMRLSIPNLVQLVSVHLVAPVDNNESVEGSRLLAAIEVGGIAAPTADSKGYLGSPDDSMPLLVELDNLRRSLLDVLPPYMVPSVLVPFAKMPLTSAGKIDRPTIRHTLSKLSKNDLSAFLVDDISASKGSKAPSSPTERMLQTLWAEILQMPVRSFGVKTISSGSEVIPSAP